MAGQGVRFVGNDVVAGQAAEIVTAGAASGVAGVQFAVLGAGVRMPAPIVVATPVTPTVVPTVPTVVTPVAPAAAAPVMRAPKPDRN